MKGLLLLYGECFRDGHHKSRITDTVTSYLPQKEASLSHIAFCDTMKQKGVDMDVLIHTYPTKYKKDLKSWYTYPTIYIEKKRRRFKTANHALDSYMNILKKVDHSYNFILLLRLDILLKPDFCTLVDVSWNKIYFFSQESTMFACAFYKGNIPIVNPVIQFIPRNYFFMLDRVNVNHDAWISYSKLGVNMDFMVEEYYRADTYQDYNPYYKMVNRPETYIHYDKSKKINRSLFNTTKKIKCKKSKKFIKF